MTVQELINWGLQPPVVSDDLQDDMSIDNSLGDRLFDAVISRIEWRLQQNSCAILQFMGEM